MNSVRHHPPPRCSPRHAPRARRRGSMLLEALIASVAISSATILAAMLLVSVNGNRRTAERLQLATEELNNQLERLTVRPYAELTADSVKGLELSVPATVGLPSGELRITLHEVTAPAAAKRLDAELRWQDRGQAWRPPLRMTAWVFASKEKS